MALKLYTKAQKDSGGGVGSGLGGGFGGGGGSGPEGLLGLAGKFLR